jgi:hypothetical protein
MFRKGEAAPRRVSEILEARYDKEGQGSTFGAGEQQTKVIEIRVRMRG